MVAGAGEPLDAGARRRRELRRASAIVAALNLSYFFVEGAVALSIGSVSLLADSADFLEDTAINLLIIIALGWSLAAQAVVGRVLAGIILVPALVAAWQVVQKAFDPVAPDVPLLVVTAGGAAVVNLVSALVLARVRRSSGSLSRAAFLSARNDVIVNVTIIGMGFVTLWTASGWPDLVLGAIIVVIAVHAAWEVWEVAGEERLAAKALAGEAID
jgi:Co/Zn/Cd efflux system component